MPHTKRHRIAPEVKEQILRRIKEAGVPVKQAASEHGLSDQTIYDWLAKGAEGAPSIGEFVKLKRENHELLRLIGALTLKLSAQEKRG